MELRDLIVAPLTIILVIVGAFIIRPYVTDDLNRKYFLPALILKIFGALTVGFIYQFYYNGGDTFNYHTHGSRHIWDAFVDDPQTGLRLLFSNGTSYEGVYKYASKMLFFQDPASYAVVKLSAIFDLLTFSSYAATAVLFAVVGFTGLWQLFITFYEINPGLHKYIALAVLFLPSVIFWGSGLLKDTITLACVGIVVNASYKIFLRNTFSIGSAIFLLMGVYGLYSIKVYILLTLLPSVILWIFMSHFSRISSGVAKILLLPVVILVSLSLGYFALLKAGEDNPKYSLQGIARTAQVTAYDIRYWTGRDAGSGYTLGELDGTWQSMAKLAPEAINVSLFRPYLWEVNNPLMLLSAMESLGLLFLTLYALYRTGFGFFRAASNPHVLFCLVFSITFAFAVGVSTFNFGTLTRYKIPLLPFYLLALILIIHQANNERKEAELDATE